MSLLKIAEALKQQSAVGLLSKEELLDALVVVIGEIPREYRDAVVKKIWTECFRYDCFAPA